MISSHRAPKMAVVVIPRNINRDVWGRPVAGMALFLRTLLALQHAGITRIQVIPSDDPGTTQELRRLVSEGNLNGLSITIKPLGIDLPSEPLWVLRANLVWHPRLFHTLMRSIAQEVTQSVQAFPRMLIDPSGRPMPLVYLSTGSMQAVSALVAAFQDKPEGPPSNLLREKAYIPLNAEINAVREVSDVKGLKAAQKMLFRQDVKLSDGIVSRYINRPISRLISQILIQTQLSPTLITWWAFGLGLAAVYFTQKGSYISFILGAVFMQINSIADGVDGEIARLKFKESSSGEWLDRILDKIVMVGFYAAIVIGHSKSNPGLVFLLIGSLTVAFFIIGFTLLYVIGHKMQRAGLDPDGLSGKSKPRMIYRLMRGMIFGSVDSPGSQLSRQKTSPLWSLNQVSKNDFLCLGYIVLAVGGNLPGILYFLCPYALTMTIFGIYGLTISNMTNS